MPVSNNILGMNARNFLFIRRYNKQTAKKIADDKLQTKVILEKNNIATPKLIASFLDMNEVTDFTYSNLPKEGFVIKPARGYGGGGILVIKKWEEDTAETITGDKYTQEQIKSHLLDVLEGAFSLQYLPDKAFIEERIVQDPFFKKMGAVGLSDIRIILLHNIPVMAMMRIPTLESKGRANIHQGAIGIGIDMRTGITTHGIYKGKLINVIPGTKNKIHGIKIPYWDQILLLASRTQNAIKGLGYAGVDTVIDAKKGPLILEVNARPGLAIQIANNSSLRTRLERIENIPIPTPERAIEVSKSLFAESFSEKVHTSPKILGVIQEVKIKKDHEDITIQAKLDTGAFRTSIDESLARLLNLKINTEEKVFVVSASGQNKRPTVNLTYELSGKKITTTASVISRAHLRYPMIIGTRDLAGFLINPLDSNPDIDMEDELENTQSEEPIESFKLQ